MDERKNCSSLSKSKKSYKGKKALILSLSEFTCGIVNLPVGNIQNSPDFKFPRSYCETTKHILFYK
jgi:hypothetical protein